MDDAGAFVTGIDDTIVAVATPRGGGFRGVIRVSGDRALSLVASCFVPGSEDVGSNARSGARAGVLRLDDAGATVPATVWVMRAPRSYTCEDTAEIHTVGSPALLEMIVDRLRGRGARVARPGEFTRRAFLNGRIDLTRAEAVAATIHARTEAERRAALAVLDGAITRRVRELACAIQAVLTPLELDLDFSDQDIDIIDAADAAASIRDILATVSALLSDRAAIARTAGRRRVLLNGPANAGKSSLFNRLVGDERAIVSATPGTTRDYLEAEISLGEVDAVLVDTAGRDFEEGDVDTAAHVLREREAARAELVVQVRDGRMPVGDVDAGDLVVLTRADLVEARDPREVWVSAVNGEGVAELRAVLARRLAADPDAGSQAFVHLQQRHRDCYERTRTALERGGAAVEAGWGTELVAADLRDALAALREITGEDYADAVLDRIFRDFCIGK